MSINIGDKDSALLGGLSGFWQKFFKDVKDIEVYYEASEVYLGQVYLDMLAAILNIGAIDTPIFNKEYWKLFTILESELDFVEGLSISEDAYHYDMPGDIVNTQFLQNSIFGPEIVLERDVDFTVEDNDGYIRFHDDPFKGYQDATGQWLPAQGLGWRTIAVEIGNRFTDRERTANWDVDSDVKKGDDLRLLGYRGSSQTSGVAGTIAYSFGLWTFEDVSLGDATIGDMIQVHSSSSPDEAFDGYYVVHSIISSTKVRLEATPYSPEGTSTTPLTWERFRTAYFNVSSTEPFRDYPITYLEGQDFIGSVDTPYPLEYTAPFVYSVVRDSATPDVFGVSLAWSSTVVPPNPTVLGYRNVIPGSVNVYAEKIGGGLVEEGVDWSMDYIRGLLYQLTPWGSGSLGKCDFQYRVEVTLAAGGEITESSVGNVKQISYWVPEVQVDRFNLWYNYGSLLNRFEASSESYKAFLRGIMYLYMTGPILERIESGLNVAARYPVVRNDGEVLVSYDDGVKASGADGTVDGTAETLNAPSYTFTEQDVGGFIIISNVINDLNKGSFRILSLVDANTVELESSYGFISETPVDWALSLTYVKTVQTTGDNYIYPYYVPIREDIEDSANEGVLTFSAFEPLTLAFTVTDYIEDPHWWHNKFIPPVLWADTTQHRRHATTQLYANVIGGSSDVRVGDPGFYVGADEEGNVVTPTDGVDPVNIFKHGTAFILFDRYLKFHMFYVSFHEDLELTAQFRTDIEELILVAKPSYTYPYVEPNASFEDVIELSDTLSFPRIAFEFGGVADNYLDSMFCGVEVDSEIVAQNYLKVGDTDFPWAVGDYYRYVDYTDETIAGAPDPVVTGYTFDIPVTGNERPLVLNIQATVGGEPVLEGRDYTVNWLVDGANPWQVKALTDWDSVSPLLVDYTAVDYDNLSITPTPDTLLGFTPVMVGGLNPGYIRAGALDPDSPTYATEWALVRTEHIDRALSLKVDEGGLPYNYP